MRRYHDVEPISRADAALAFDSAEPDAIADALIRLAYHDPDWQWVESRCLAYCRDPNSDVRGAAITCLGHLARIHGALHLGQVLPVLLELRSDPAVGGRAEDALDDIRTYVPVA